MLKTLLGILNSRLIHIWLYNRGKRKGEMLELFPTSLQQIPIIIPQKTQIIVSLVDKILAAKAADPQADTQALERDLDNLVYRLYNLTYDEVKVIERDCGAVRFAVSKAEWEG
jgi:hypothetical protein